MEYFYCGHPWEVESVLISEVSYFQGVILYTTPSSRDYRQCTNFRGVLIEGFHCTLYASIIETNIHVLNFSWEA